MSWLKNNPWKAVFIVFFAFVTVISLFTFKNYGISIDEPIQHQHLLITAKKAFSALGILDSAPQSIKSAADLSSYEHRFYGVAAQYPLLILEFFPDTFAPNLPAFWLARHLYTRVIFLLGAVAFFFIAKKITKSPLILLLSLTAYFLHPRVSAHSFYNIKDSIFLSFFVISMYFLFQYLETRKFKDLFLLGIFSATTVNVRLMGILIPAFLAFWLTLEVALQKQKIKQNLKPLLLFSPLFLAILYLIWPALWGSPQATLTAAFSKFANYDAWDGWILFAGDYISAKNPPKTYLPVWIAVTTPWSHLLLWVLGLILPALLIFKKSCRNYLEKPYIFLSAHFFIWASFLPIIILGSTLYSGWRHVQYLFGPLMLLFVYALALLWKKFSPRVFAVIVTLVSLSLVYTLGWMVANHPFEYAYFNALAGKNWNQNWEHDYWWVSSKQLLEHLLQSQEGDLTVCAGGTGHVPLNLNLIPLDERSRIKLDCSEALEGLPSYYLHNSNTLGDFKLEGFERVYTVTVGGEVISSVYKLVEK